MTPGRTKSLQQRRKHIEHHHLAPRSNPTTNHVNTEPILTCKDLPFFPTTTRTRESTQIKQTSTRLPTTIPKPTAQEKETQFSSAIQALDKQRKKGTRSPHPNHESRGPQSTKQGGKAQTREQRTSIPRSRIPKSPRSRYPMC
jgi:hypothetical protein